jgi:hypothetical protein
MVQPVSDSDWVTVFRSGEHTAEEEASAACELLRNQGIRAALADADTPGVPFGTWEVRVPATEGARAEAIIAAQGEETAPHGDASHDMDLVTLFTSDAHNAEMEAMAVQGILEAGGIPSVLVGFQAMPSLPFEVRVPSARADEARRLIAESQAGGPEAAELAEKASERPE